MKFPKITSGIVGLALALTLVVGAGVQTASAAALTSAQVQAILSLLTSFGADASTISNVQASLTGGTVTTTTTTTSSSALVCTNLTVGSMGANVTALQNFLIGNGNAIPAGATGYFGAQTKAALAAYQSAKGITPAVGYFGPISCASINAFIATNSGSTTGGTTTTTTTTGSTGITTVGKEGIMTVSLNSTPIPSNVYAGGQKVGLIGVKVQAQNSDLDVQRIMLNLGTNSKIWNKVYMKFYVQDASGNVLATMDSNASNVTKSGSTYYLTLTGFHYVVPVGTTNYLVVSADLYNSIDSATVAGTSFTVTIDANAVRAVDGAGIDVYGPTTAFSQSATAQTSLVDTASLSISTDSSTPKVGNVVAASGSSNNEQDNVPFLTINLFAQKDNVDVTDLVALFIGDGAAGATDATVTTAYLYDGSTLVGSASVNSSTGYANFTNMDIWVNKDTHKILTLTGDVRTAQLAADTIYATATSTGVVAENSSGTSLTSTYLTGSAVGTNQVVRKVGPVFTLVNKSITKSATALQNNYSTSTASALFTLQISAVGGDISFGTVASVTPAFGTSTTYFKVYQDGAASTTAVASTTSYETPGSGVVTTNLTNTFTLSQGNTITLPVTFTIEGKYATIGGIVPTANYSIGLEGIKWYNTSSGSAQTSNFMASNADWRTSTVALP